VALSPEQIVALVLTSSLLAAGLSSLVTWRLQRTSYKDDFYRILIKYRLEAYEHANKMLTELSNITSLPNNRTTLTILAHGFDHFEEFGGYLLRAKNSASLLSQELNDLLAKLTLLMTEITSDYLKLDPEDHEAIAQLGQRHMPLIFQLCGQIGKQLYQDLSSIHKIKSFFTRIKEQHENYLAVLQASLASNVKQ